MVNLLYSKIIIEEIIRFQALGFSAEETRIALKDKYGKQPALNTIYKYRRSPIGQEMIEELIRHQERDILKADSENIGLAMKYRDKLLALLLPQKIMSYHKEDVNIEERRELNVTLEDYRESVQKVVDRYIRTDSTP